MKLYHDFLYIDSRTGFDTTDTIVVVSNTMSGKHADLVAKCADTWNSIPQWRRKNVRKLHMKHLNGSAGLYAPCIDTISIDPRKADEAFDDMSWLFEHEIAHLNFAHYNLGMVRKWIKCAGSLDPISQYSRAWLHIGTDEFVERMNDCKTLIDLSRMKTLDNDEQILYYVLKAGFVDAINNAGGSVKGNSIINAARREYITGLDIYSNEQHSEFMAIHYGKYEDEYDKTVYRKLKKLYKSIHGIAPGTGMHV